MNMPTVTVENGYLVIRTEIRNFVSIVENAWKDDEGEWKVKDEKKFAEAIGRELTRENDDGGTPVTSMLYSALVDVLDKGCSDAVGAAEEDLKT
jgi:hypothetical protein